MEMYFTSFYYYFTTYFAVRCLMRRRVSYGFSHGPEGGTDAPFMCKHNVINTTHVHVQIHCSIPVIGYCFGFFP